MEQNSPQSNSYRPTVMRRRRYMDVGYQESIAAVILAGDLASKRMTPPSPALQYLGRTPNQTTPGENVSSRTTSPRSSIVDWKTYQVPPAYRHATTRGPASAVEAVSSSPVTNVISSSSLLSSDSPVPTRAAQTTSLAVSTTPTPTIKTGRRSFTSSPSNKGCNTSSTSSASSKPPPACSSSRQLTPRSHTQSDSNKKPRSLQSNLRDELCFLYASNDKPDDRLVTLEAGLASLARHTDLQTFDTPVFLPTHKHSAQYFDPSTASAGGRVDPTPRGVSYVPRASRLLRRSSAIWRPHAFAPGAPIRYRGSSESLESDLDPFAPAGTSFYAECKDEPMDLNIYDLSPYAVPRLSPGKLPVYERWTRRVRSLPGLRKPPLDEIKAEVRQRQQEYAEIDRSQVRVEAKEQRPNEQSTLFSQATRTKARTGPPPSTAALLGLRRKAENLLPVHTPTVLSVQAKPVQRQNKDRVEQHHGVSTRSTLSLPVEVISSSPHQPQDEHIPSLDASLGAHHKGTFADAGFSSLTLETCDTARNRDPMHELSGTRSSVHRTNPPLKPLLLVEKLASEEDGDQLRSKQIDDLIVLLNLHRDEPARTQIPVDGHRSMRTPSLRCRPTFRPAHPGTTAAASTSITRQVDALKRYF